ncbi:MAG: response regulator [Acidobacteria bacterium]|nr:response regulator [Acidobacteriota bacterium]
MARADILIVDDDPSLLHFAARYLGRLGHGVLACRGAQEAWDRFAQEPEGLRLVLIDISMEQDSGEALARRMLAANPGLRLLFWSGYPFDVDQFAASAPGVRVEFLHKPFSPALLRSAVERLLAD